MHIINTRERNQAFIRFLLFFLITCGLIVSAVYVDFKMLPSRETDFWKAEALQFRTNNNRQDQFVRQMQKTKILLDSLTAGTKIHIANDIKWRGYMTDLEKLKLDDSSSTASLNSMVISTFIELQQLKKEMIELREIASNVQLMEARLNQCQGQLNNFITAQSGARP